MFLEARTTHHITRHQFQPRFVDCPRESKTHSAALTNEWEKASGIRLADGKVDAGILFEPLLSQLFLGQGELVTLRSHSPPNAIAQGVVRSIQDDLQCFYHKFHYCNLLYLYSNHSEFIFENTKSVMIRHYSILFIEKIAFFSYNSYFISKRIKHTTIDPYFSTFYCLYYLIIF